MPPNQLSEWLKLSGAEEREDGFWIAYLRTSKRLATTAEELPETPDIYIIAHYCSELFYGYSVTELVEILRFWKDVPNIAVADISELLEWLPAHDRISLKKLFEETDES